MKQRIILWLVATSLVLVPVTSFGQKPANNGSDAKAAVKAFYAFHFQHKFDYSLPGLKLRHRWLDENLYRLLVAELKKPVKPDEVPDLDGDPFTNSQEYPNGFRVGKSEQDGKLATVDVIFFWKDKKKVLDTKRVKVQLAKSAEGWKIANVIAEGGDDLIKFLKRGR